MDAESVAGLMRKDQQDSLPYSIELHQKDNHKYFDISGNVSYSEGSDLVNGLF